jgi:hypothetical protein
MRKFFKVAVLWKVIILITVSSAGCMTYSSHFEGFKVTQNYPAGSSNWQPLPPSHTEVWHVGSDTHGKVEHWDDGGRECHRHH